MSQPCTGVQLKWGWQLCCEKRRCLPSPALQVCARPSSPGCPSDSVANGCEPQPSPAMEGDGSVLQSGAEVRGRAPRRSRAIPSWCTWQGPLHSTRDSLARLCSPPKDLRALCL